MTRRVQTLIWGLLLASVIAWSAALAYRAATGLPAAFSLDGIPSLTQSLIALTSLVLGMGIMIYFRRESRA